MDITVKDWLELHRVSCRWFYAHIEIYQDKTFTNNLIYEFDIDCMTELKDVLNKMPYKYQEKKIEHVEFIRGDDCDSVAIALRVKE